LTIHDPSQSTVGRSSVRVLRLVLGLALTWAGAASLGAQESQRDTLARDSIRAFVLDPVQVTVTRTPSRLDDVTFAVSRVPRDQLLKGRPGLGLDEAMVAVPGLIAANRYNYSLDQLISIRGFGARSSFGVRGVKILLDGVPQTLPDGQGQLSNLELGELGTVEVLRGSSSSLYGNASGGVISLVSEEPPLDRAEPGARLTVGEYGLIKWQAGGAAPLGRGTAQVSVSRTTSDGFRDHSTADIRQLTARLVQSVGQRTRLTFAARINDSPELLNPGALTADEVLADPAQADSRNVAAGAGKAVQQWQASLAATHAVSGEATIEGSLFGLGRQLDNPLAFRYIALDRAVWGGRVIGRLPLGVGSLRPVMSAGLDVQRQGDDRVEESTDRTEVLLAQRERVLELGPFVELSMPVSGRTMLTSGVRYDRVAFRVDDELLTDGDDSGERVMDAVSWSIGVAHEIGPAVMPYASVSTSFETPTTTELANSPGGAGGFNPDLEPQRATNYEVGIRGRLGGAVRYAVAGYVADVRDELIPFEVPGSPNERFFRNAGSSWHRGIELEAMAVPFSRLAVVAAYTYSAHAFREYRVTTGTATDTLDGNELPGVPPHFTHLGLRYDGPMGVWAGVDVTHSASFYVDDQNQARNASWTVTGLRLGWDGAIAKWRTAPFVGVLNLFNEGYASSVVVNARGGRYYEPAPPRNVYVGVVLGAAR